MVYQFSQGAAFSKSVSAQAIGERLELLCKQNGLRSPNELQPSVVVEDARDPNSPQHSCFTWDNNKAAEERRLEQAGYLIRHIVVVNVSTSEPAKPYRAFVSVSSKQAGGGRVYVPLQTALKDEDYRKNLLDSARKEYLQFKAKYASVKGLQDLFEAGDLVFSRKRSASLQISPQSRQGVAV